MTEDEFAAYQSLSEETEDHRWAFGTGFADPLEGIDTSVPHGTDATMPSSGSVNPVPNAHRWSSVSSLRLWYAANSSSVTGTSYMCGTSGGSW